MGARQESMMGGVREFRVSWDPCSQLERTFGVTWVRKDSWLTSRVDAAALGFMFDDMNEDALAPRPAVAAPPPALKPNHAPLFQAATPSPPPSPRGNTIDLISSDDEPLAPRRLDKGKGRADQNAPEVIEISSDESDGEVVERRLIPRSRPRLPSVSPPLRTAPVNEDTALASVLVVFPDALPSYVLDLLRHPSHRGNPDSVVEILLSGTYPKVVKKRKREEDDDDDIEVIPEVDWLDVKKRKAVDVHYKVAAYVSSLPLFSSSY